jgi:hypothetical protein
MAAPKSARLKRGGFETGVSRVVGSNTSARRPQREKSKSGVRAQCSFNEGLYRNSRERGDPEDCLRDAELKRSKENQKQFHICTSAFALKAFSKWNP